jgi:hypothetical protein
MREKFYPVSWLVGMGMRLTVYTLSARRQDVRL